MVSRRLPGLSGTNLAKQIVLAANRMPNSEDFAFPAIFAKAYDISIKS